MIDGGASCDIMIADFQDDTGELAPIHWGIPVLGPAAQWLSPDAYGRERIAAFGAAVMVTMANQPAVWILAGVETG